MASGIQVADECVTTYQQLKLRKKLKYIFFTLNDSLSEVIVEKTSDASSYDAFVAELPEDQCRWAVYDFEYKPEGEGKGKRNKLCFILWSPDSAKIKDKTLFASTHDAFKRKLDGIAFQVQGTDPSEISYEMVLSKALR